MAFEYSCFPYLFFGCLDYDQLRQITTSLTETFQGTFMRCWLRDVWEPQELIEHFLLIVHLQLWFRFISWMNTDKKFFAIETVKMITTSSREKILNILKHVACFPAVNF